MRDGYPTLFLRLKRARKLGAVCLPVLLGAVLGLEGQAAPVITSISPESGTNYHRVTITGTGFGSSQGTSTVTFAGTEASRYYEWSDTEIEARPPTSLAHGASAVVVTVGGVASNGVDYTRLPQLTAYCLSPSQTIAEPSGTFQMGVYRSGPTTDAVTVTLTYLGTATHGADYTAPATLTVAAGDSRSTATLAVVDDAGKEGSERITYRVSAEGYIGDNCQITLEDDDPNGTPAPAINRINPTSGGAGVSVAITGTNFGATKGTSDGHLPRDGGCDDQLERDLDHGGGAGGGDDGQRGDGRGPGEQRDGVHGDGDAGDQRARSDLGRGGDLGCDHGV